MIIENHIVQFCRVRGKPKHREVRIVRDDCTTISIGFVAKSSYWRAYLSNGKTIDARAPRRKDAAASLVRRHNRSRKS